MSVTRRATTLAFVLLAATSRVARAQTETVTLFVPVIVSTSGLNNSFFTSEMVLTNRGSSDATISYAYTDATGKGGSGTAADPQTLRAGRQRVVPDAVAFLRGLGVPIASGNAVGTLRVTFTGLHTSGDAAITVRTTTPVPTNAPTGRAGLAYFGVPPLGLLAAGTQATLCGLRQNASDRTNVAVQNAGASGDGDLTLRLTYYPSLGSPSSPTVVTLSPGGFKQYALTDLDPSATNGVVTVTVDSGSAPFYAYGVVNDQVNSDGSFIPPLKSGTGASSAVLLLPTVVETPTFATEVVLTNLSGNALPGNLTFTSAQLLSPASVPVSLSPHEQRIIPGFVQYLRDSGVPFFPPAGTTIVGTLTFTSGTGAATTSFIGGRTLNAGGGGRYGVFTSGQPDGTGADLAGTWLYGLRQDAENRTNVALVNMGNQGNASVTLRVQLYDGASGTLQGSVDQSVPPHGFVQLNTVLATYAPVVTQGWARVTRVAGTSGFVAYAVVNDGAQPGQRSGDGAVVPMDPFDTIRYAGSWNNTTFATSGALSTTVAYERISGQYLATTTIGGNVFGGSAPPPFTLRGTPTEDGGALVTGNPAFLGPVSVTFRPDFTFTGSAPSVPGPNVSAVSFSGALTESLISGTYTATLRPSGTALGTFSMAMVP